MMPVRRPAQMFFVFMNKHTPFLFDKVDIGRYQGILALPWKIYLRLLRQDACHLLQKDGVVSCQKPVIEFCYGTWKGCTSTVTPFEGGQVFATSLPVPLTVQTYTIGGCSVVTPLAGMLSGTKDACRK